MPALPRPPHLPLARQDRLTFASLSTVLSKPRCPVFIASDLFDEGHGVSELVTSIWQAGRIRHGTLKAARTTVFRPANVKAVLAKREVSQSGFALMIGVGVATLRSWEQGRRTPDGPALALL